MLQIFHKKSSKGFTLIELLVVIAIIGVLASIVLASLNTARKKGRDARRIADIKQIQTALELYFDSNANYPADINALVAGKQLPVEPKDPQSGAIYSYAALGTGSTCNSYHLGANLEEGGTGSTALKSDADASAGTTCSSSTLTVDFSGADTAGCDGTAGVFCYDVKP